jgi:hypothetical protein
MHYHMAIKLDRVQRWLSVKDRLHNHYGITVNFSGHHHNYFSAWSYVTKEDASCIHSEAHPDLADGQPPVTANASRARADGRGKRKRGRLTAFDVGEIVIRKKIKNRLELMALCQAQKAEGKTDLAEFVFNRGKKVVEETISTAWEMEGAQAALDRAQMRRLEILNTVRNSPCIPECGGQWYEQARNILARNGIAEAVFGDAVVTLLREGRGKYKNILITGPANCGKSFLINPLSQIYRCFVNPATTSYAWLGAEDAEVILLNDFRWTPQVTISQLFQSVK